MNSKNNKILFVVSSYHQYQAYIQTQALKEIKDRVVFIITPGLMKMDFGVSSDRIFSYAYPDHKNILHRYVFNINICMRRHDPSWGRYAWFSKRQKRIYRILSLPVLNEIAKFIFLKRAEDKDLFELIKKIDPAVILLPSHIYEGRTFEIIRIAKKIKIPSFVIIDNWDTLSNRTIFTIKPDFLGVWSKQQVEQAVSWMGMPNKHVFILGTPKFMDYMKPESRLQPSPYPFRYALCVGMSDPFDELGVLRKLDEIIERRKIDLKIVYRPYTTQHTRNCPDVFFEYDFKHIILDTPAKLYYKRSAAWDISSKDGFNPIYCPDLNYYPKLLSNMEFMISPQTTMILEASLFDKKVYILAYNDGVHRFGPHWAFKQGRYLFNLERLENTRMIYKIEDMEKIFTPGDELKQPILPAQASKPIDIDHFVSKEATTNYPANLKRIVDTILTPRRFT